MDPQLEYIRNLPEEEKNLLNLYTTSFYEDFNYRLRQEWPLNKIQEKVYNVLVKCFDEVPELESPIVLYRGVKYEDFNTFAPVSMSLDKSISEQFIKGDCCLYEITVLKSSKVLPLYEISSIKHEMEVLGLFGKFVEIAESFDNLITKFFTYDNIGQFKPCEKISIQEKISIPVEEKAPEKNWQTFLKVALLNPDNAEEIELLGVEEFIEILKLQFENF